MSTGRLRLAAISAVPMIAALLSPGAGAPGSEEPPAPFELKKGDHICIIGNALAERMQHDGWLEASLHARFPEHNLTIRNLGFSGDEVGGYTDKPDFARRLRSLDFGTADQWLGAKAPIPKPDQVADKRVLNPNRVERVRPSA